MPELRCAYCLEIMISVNKHASLSVGKDLIPSPYKVFNTNTYCWLIMKEVSSLETNLPLNSRVYIGSNWIGLPELLEND